jgi:hypothetical protein
LAFIDLFFGVLDLRPMCQDCDTVAGMKIREEITETLGMAIYMGAGPAAMYASHALEAYTQFSTLKTA